MIAHVIGHTGCPKCELLNRRLDAILKEDPYKSHFAKVYHDTEDPRGLKEKEEALVFFCKTQCINPNRIPAMIVTDDNGNFLERKGRPVNSNQLYQFVGIQTDYTSGGGILPPELIKETLDEAMGNIQ